MKNKKDNAFSTGFLIWQSTLIWQRQMNAVLVKKDLTHVQFLCLKAIADLVEMGELFLSQRKIANYAQIDLMMASNVINALDRKKLIKRKDNKDDKRAKMIELSAKGQSLLKVAIKDAEKVESKFFSISGKEQNDIHKTLNKLMKSHTKSK